MRLGRSTSQLLTPLAVTLLLGGASAEDAALSSLYTACGGSGWSNNVRPFPVSSCIPAVQHQHLYCFLTPKEREYSTGGTNVVVGYGDTLDARLR